MNYAWQYYAQVLITPIGIVAGVLAGVGYIGAHPGWLTTDVAATAGIIAACCAGLNAWLPQLSRTPGIREQRYLDAQAGTLPDDLAAKHP